MSSHPENGPYLGIRDGGWMLWMRKSKNNQNGSPQASETMSIEAEDVVEGLLDAKDCLRAWPLFGPVREARGHLEANRDRDSDDGPKAEQDHRTIYKKNATRLAYYLRNDVPGVLNDIADRLDTSADRYDVRQSSDDDRQRHAALVGDDEQDDAGHDDHDRDFSETDFVRKMTQAGNMEVPASFLRGLGELMQSLGDTLDPQGDALLQLKLMQRRPGKLSDPMSQLLNESRITTTARLSRVKKEAAVQELISKMGVSRATIFRALSRSKSKKVMVSGRPATAQGRHPGQGAKPKA